MSINGLAKHVLAVADKEDNPVSNLELQKILFFTVGMSIRNDVKEIKFFKKIYNNDFEKWRYGPVVPSLYFSYNIYGNKSIQETGQYNENYKRFDDLIKKLFKIDVYRLVALSHKLDSWLNYEEDILNGRWVNPYSLEEIVRDFIDE